MSETKIGITQLWTSTKRIECVIRIDLKTVLKVIAHRANIQKMRIEKYNRYCADNNTSTTKIVPPAYQMFT